MDQQTVVHPAAAMGTSNVRDRAGRSRLTGRSVFDLYPSKLHWPPVRPGAIRRSSLIKQLAGGVPGPIVSVVAPPGYGKTTLLSQWAETVGQAFAWVSVDQGDNDPKVLLSYIANALDAVEPIDGGVFDALASPVSSVPGSVVPAEGDRGPLDQASLPEVERRQVQPGRPALGSPVQFRYVIGGERDACSAQQRCRLLPGQRQVAGADLQDPALGAQPGDPQRWPGPAGQHQP